MAEIRKILLDTQPFVSAYIGAPLPKRVLALFQKPDLVELCLSTASLFEIAIKQANGKLKMNEHQTAEAVRDLALTVLPFTSQHAFRLFRLPPIHKDPFDRVIIATALVEDLPIVTSDRVFRRYKEIQLI